MSLNIYLKYFDNVSIFGEKKIALQVKSVILGTEY